MNRCEKCGTPMSHIPGLIIDMDRGEIRFRGGVIPCLSAMLMRVVEHLATHPGHCRSKGQISDAIYWDVRGRDVPGDKIIDVFICKLRKKLPKLGLGIKTHWGSGYELVAPGLTSKETPQNDPMTGEIKAAIG